MNKHSLLSTNINIKRERERERERERNNKKTSQVVKRLFISGAYLNFYSLTRVSLTIYD
jgi:hypothetical protein